MSPTPARFLSVCPSCALVYSAAAALDDCPNCDLSIPPRVSAWPAPLRLVVDCNPVSPDQAVAWLSKTRG